MSLLPCVTYTSYANLTHERRRMATIGETLQYTATLALEIVQRFEDEPLNKNDYKDSVEYKAKKDYILQVKNRVQ